MPSTLQLLPEYHPKQERMTITHLGGWMVQGQSMAPLYRSLRILRFENHPAMGGVAPKRRRPVPLSPS